MQYSKLVRWGGLLNLVLCILFFLWWGLMGAITVSSGNLNISTLELVRQNGYQLQSILGLIACILTPFGLMALYLPFAERVGKMGLAGFLLSCLGVILYGSMQFDETFAWPVLAHKAPALLQNGGLLSDAAYMFVFILMGLVLAAGFILFGIAYVRTGIFPHWAVIFYSAGGTLFGIGMAVPIRTLGLLLWVIGWGVMGFNLWKQPALSLVKISHPKIAQPD